MEKDFHYYCVAVLARTAGFPPEDALTIAYASQYVDDSQDSAPLAFLEDEEFRPQATAHFGFASFADETCRNIYVPFHFLPPQPSASTPASFVTQPDSLLARELMEMALAQSQPLERLVSLGVALHTYADTWAHQGFSGWQDALNQAENIFQVDENGVLGQFLRGVSLGNVGHIQVRSYPDRPYLRWRYLAGPDRREVVRNNKAEFMTAAQRIHQWLSRASGAPGRPWSEINSQVAELLGVDSTDGEARCGAWQEAFATLFNGGWEYDRMAWRWEAIERDDSFGAGGDDDSPTEPEPVYQWKGDPAQLPWAAFHRAARRQRRWVRERVFA